MSKSRRVRMKKSTCTREILPPFQIKLALSQKNSICQNKIWTFKDKTLTEKKNLDPWDQNLDFLQKVRLQQIDLEFQACVFYSIATRDKMVCKVILELTLFVYSDWRTKKSLDLSLRRHTLENKEERRKRLFLIGFIFLYNIWMISHIYRCNKENISSKKLR